MPVTERLLVIEVVAADRVGVLFDADAGTECTRVLFGAGTGLSAGLFAMMSDIFLC